jgi:hypothetical protein
MTSVPPVVNAPVAPSSPRSVQHIERTGSVGLAAAVVGGVAVRL